MTEEKLRKQIVHSSNFNDETSKLLAQVRPLPKPQCRMAIGLAGISIEHADSIRMLLFTLHLTSAMALLRLQYESLVRAMWVGYAANEQWIATHDTPLTEESIPFKEGLSVETCLKHLEKIAEVPRSAYFSLMQFHEQSWKALCSYVHSGKHPLKRTEGGYPVHLLITISQHSTQLMTMAASTAIAMAGNQPLMDEFMKLQQKHKHCFAPYIPPAPTSNVELELL